MEIAQTTKKELFREIEQLSSPYLEELQNFIQYLKFKQTSKVATSIDRRVLSPENDPILRLIGIVDVSPFSENLDDMLYGET
ncbi:hypothetical protein BGP_5392 [Beggiatoa sp. PS]|nr:hypothetical protein BGP_5392 [Beggiatoa sp. PS]